MDHIRTSALDHGHFTVEKELQTISAARDTAI